MYLKRRSLPNLPSLAACVRPKRTFLASALAGIALAALSAVTACAPPRSGRVVIGAKNFTEQVILGELLAQEVEAISAAQGHPEPVERRFYLAGSYLCQQALVSGRIDAYVEYTGTALTAILKQPLPPPGPARTPEAVFATVSRLYEQRFHIRAEPSLGFEDTFAMVIRRADADRLKLHALSEAARLIDSTSVQPNLDHRWRLGVGYEFESRPDGLPGLSAAYDLHFAAPPRTMDLGLLYRALAAGQVDIVAGNSTDGPIRALNLTVLTDDRHYFPPYQAVPLIREDALSRHPVLQLAAQRLAGKLTASDVQAMNEAVDAQHRDPAEVVREFRQAHGL